MFKLYSIVKYIDQVTLAVLFLTSVSIPGRLVDKLPDSTEDMSLAFSRTIFKWCLSNITWLTTSELHQFMLILMTVTLFQGHKETWGNNYKPENCIIPVIINKDSASCIVSIKCLVNFQLRQVLTCSIYYAQNDFHDCVCLWVKVRKSVYSISSALTLSRGQLKVKYFKLYTA